MSANSLNTLRLPPKGDMQPVYDEGVNVINSLEDAFKQTKLPEMKNKITILILFIFSVIPGIVRGANVADADSAYNAKEYAKAISIYNELIEENGTSAPVLFNLGSAYYQAGDYGQAMLNYLRARRLDPGNEEINANLRYLQSRVEDANKAEQKGNT